MNRPRPAPHTEGPTPAQKGLRFAALGVFILLLVHTLVWAADFLVPVTAAFLGLDYAPPNPSPVAFTPGKFAAQPEQPLVAMLYDLFLAASDQGNGLSFIDSVMRLIWDGRTPGWDQGDHLDRAIAGTGLDRKNLATIAARDREALAERMAANESEMLRDGHWGVPLFVYRGEPFYGQDRLDQLTWRLEGGT